MGACISSTSRWGAHGAMRVLLAGCTGASMQSVLQQLQDDSVLKTPESQSLIRENKPENDVQENGDRFEFGDIQFSLINPICSSSTLASTSLHDQLKAHVGNIEMVLFVVRLSWYDEEVEVDDEKSKGNHMEYALSQFCTLCEMFANTDAGLGVILEDYPGLVNKLSVSGAGNKISDHFSDYAVRDEGNATAAARYFAKCFQDIYNAHSPWSNCFIYVARNDKCFSHRKTKMNDLAQFLLESSKSVLRSQQMRSLLMEEQSKLQTMKLACAHKNTAKGKGGNNNHPHWMATPKLNDSTTSISSTEDYYCNNTSHQMRPAFVA